MMNEKTRDKNMLKEIRHNISIKESVIFCLLSGLFIYGICCLPCLHLYLFPPQNTGGITFTMACLEPPDKYPFIISFSLLAFIGIWVLTKANFQNRIAYFSFLALILAVGGGFLTGALETIYYVFIVSDNPNQEYFWATLDESYYGFAYSIKWMIAFVVIQIPFAAIFLITKALISTSNSLK